MCVRPLYPQAESKEDDKHFASHQFGNLTERMKTGIFNVALDWTFQFFP